MASEKRSISLADQEKAGKKTGEMYVDKERLHLGVSFQKVPDSMQGTHTHTHPPNTYSQNPGLRLVSYSYLFSGLSLAAQLVKNLPAKQETRV